MKHLLISLCIFLLCLSMISCSSVATVPTQTGATSENPAAAATGENSADGGHNTENCFSVGFARESISPESSVPLGGYGNSSFRMSKKVLDEIAATCVAFSDGTDTILCYTVDEVGLADTFCKKAAELISAKTKVPVENILICCTHSHSTPDELSGEGSIASWKALVYAAFTKAGEEAIADRDKAEIFYGSTNVPGLTFVRHYLLADNTYSGDNSGNDSTAAIVSHETEADSQLQILKFDRESQKDVILANFQSHPTMTGGSSKTDVSADYVGAFRKAVEKDTGASCAFFQGAAGNLNPKSKIAGEALTQDYTEFGKILSDGLVSQLSALQKAEPGKVSLTSKTVTAEINHSTDVLATAAQLINSRFEGNDREGANALCKEYGITSPYAASAIISRKNMEASQDITIYAFTIGEIAFVGAPYEMFDTNGMSIKQNSPFKMTFVCEQCNGRLSYLPSAVSYPHGGYEVGVSRFVQGTAEVLEGEFLSMLTALHSAS